MIDGKTWILTGLLLAASAGLCVAQEPPPPPSPPADSGRVPGWVPGESGPQHRRHHRFVDLNGDGINDLAPDRDRNGWPDAMDPMFRGPQARWRMKWFLMMPEAAKQDSSAFASWWKGFNHRVPPDRAWNRWKNAWFYSLPDSAKANQETFRSWWLETRRPGDWEMAWHSWHRWLNMGPPDFMDRRDMRDRMGPGSGPMNPGQGGPMHGHRH